MLAEDYASGRMNVPEAIIDFIFGDQMAITDRVLDLGCGTGISTRQIASRAAEVVGCDPDPTMLAHAISAGGKNIRYVVGRATHIPEKDASFDGVTIFSAFHWFANREAISEIFRVIRPGGWLAIINRENAPEYELRLRSVLADFAAEMPPSAKRGYAPESLLVREGVTKMRVATFSQEEVTSRSVALSYVMSRSVWNYVPFKLRSSAKISVQNWLDSRINKRGKIVRKVEIKCVFASDLPVRKSGT